MKLRIKAPAKINLFLEVKAKRADGFHELEMLMQKLELADLLLLETAFLSRAGREQKALNPTLKLTCSDSRIPTDERNLVWKAWQLLAADFPEKFAAKPLARIHIKKCIPQQAGLAGGSSDAASALMGLNQLYQLGLDRQDLCSYGQKLGSDVNFFFYGPSCLVRGRGEVIEENSPLPALYLVLLKPKRGLSAAKVYNKLKLPAEASLTPLPALSGFPDDFQPFNRLEEPAFEIWPALEIMKKDLLAQNPLTLMSGSGTSFFSLFTKKKEAEDFYRFNRNKYKFAALTAFAQEATYKEDLK